MKATLENPVIWRRITSKYASTGLSNAGVPHPSKKFFFEIDGQRRADLYSIKP